MQRKGRHAEKASGPSCIIAAVKATSNAPQYGVLAEGSTAVIWLAGLVMAAVGLGGYALWALNGNLVRGGNWIGVDFHVYYQAARVLQRGGDIYTAGIAPPYVYPPLLAMLVVPLAALPVDTATILWKVLQHICLLGAGALLVSMVPARIRPLAGGALLLGLLTVPVHDEIQVGESNSLVLLLVVGAVWLIARTERMQPGDTGDMSRNLDWGSFNGASIAAGLLLALAASIKVLPILLILYLWWRGPRQAAAVATAGFAVLQMLLLALTPSTAGYWLNQFPALFGQPFPYLDNQSINAFVSRATLPAADPGMPSSQLFDWEAGRAALTWALNALALLAAAWVLWRDQVQPRVGESERRSRLLLQVGLVMLATHLVSGSTWLHHLIDLCVPVIGLLALTAVTTWRSGRIVPYLVGTGLIYGALLFRPADWVTLADRLAPGVAPLALLAGSLPMFAVIGLAVWSGKALLTAGTPNA